MSSIIHAFSVAVVALTLLVPVHLSAQATDVTGEWAFTVETDQGGGTPVMKWPTGCRFYHGGTQVFW